ncbi:phosphoglucosamine mutase [Coraliomargarita parva]|uniref:phosphoglucosamine mutase n=1 Tax=Coraliomargarita parva TaxID=3014050 RepID=UPI0022B59487|nr:phosphoglucosamine mutase [Coraliomargarita parva]
MGKYFGTDGVRGTYGDTLMNTGFAYRLGSALGRYLAASKRNAMLNAVIGRDTRMSGPNLVDALVQGLNKHGVHVHDLGIVPTPAVAQSVLEQLSDVGIAVTASHNPAQDNGIKLFNSKGCKLTVVEEDALEKLVDAESDSLDDRPLAKSYPLDGAAFYINYLSSLMDQGCLCGWKIVLDLANGATCETSPAVFRRWGAELILIGDNPDGENINKGVGSECPQALCQAVREHKANLGVAHDGDGDRLVVCDEKGELVDGDVLLGIFGLYALKSGALRNNTLVATIQSNLGLDHALRQAGGRVERVDVGDRNVARKMRSLDVNIGGESSGHIIFSDFATTGDGLLAAVKLVELMCKTRKPLSQLRREITLFPQKTLNLKVAEKRPLDTLKKLPRAMEKLEAEFGESGRLLVRYSGTEPKLRLLVEAEDPKVVTKALKSLEKAARADLEVIDS